MTDEELRTFCVEQAVLIFAKKEQVKTMGFRDMEDMTLLELSDRLYNYIRTGEQSFIPASLSYLKKIIPIYLLTIKIYLMEWISGIVILLIFSPLAIFIFGSGVYLIYRIVSDLSSQKAEELERQKRKAEAEPLVQYLKEYYPLVYRAIFPD